MDLEVQSPKSRGSKQGLCWLSATHNQLLGDTGRENSSEGSTKPCPELLPRHLQALAVSQDVFCLWTPAWQNDNNSGLTSPGSV